LAGLPLLCGAGSARADFVLAFAPDRSAAMGSNAGGMASACGESATGEVQVRPENERGRNPAGDRVFAPFVLQPGLFGPASPSHSSMGGTGGPDSGGSGQPIGLSARPPSLADQRSGRFFLIYVYHLPPPFPSSLFHPPRSL
jgi:hypothetical protein